MEPVTSENNLRDKLRTVCEAISEKGYDPVRQITEYIISEDPTYIPDYKNARGIIRHISREELVRAMLESFLGEI